ncbi:MOSC and FAD-binding oxidoreductase domain-containing protein [Mycobacterium paraterrae]|uniref:MOSC and FAD-binding oxidoreductase domain-containing protein n=1 Tax=Mycobacterium paraterrae TaxID=577492 RepID=A0ABY3VJL9_9MYCO|nr:MOSC and FAD-binding oxidoreductase domain-containing protein [Mycobacterium paraterrae]UMB69580.1 MOSC and FAD-binding oxidoreductase domain-containing protein [Mycobacterium paraterrae]
MAKLVSVNVGMPKDVAWQGRNVYTGIWKSPVTGPRMVRRLNIDGDGQGDLAGHGGEIRAVLVYQLASYDHWAAELGRSDLEPGAFGENFTVDGLPDDEVCIGDRYRIGEAVLEVTQPRVTCYRVGIRLGEPRMPALLVSHRRPGFYCRVLAEGEVEAGQAIEKIADGPEKITVAEIDALLYLPGHRRDALQRALGIPALSPGWKWSLQKLLDQDTGTAAGNSGLTGSSTPPPAWPGFRQLRVIGIHDESHSVRSISLADPDNTALPKWLPGQSITVRVPAGPDGAPLIRNYSLSNDPGSGTYRISVKREPSGTVSSYIHAHVRPDDVLDVAAPRGAFFLDDGNEPVILLSAGVGATPVLSMLHSLATSASTRPVWWLYGARDGTEHPFAAEARGLLNTLPRWQSAVFYSRPGGTDRLGEEYDKQGRLSVGELSRLGLPTNAQAFICGPESFMDAMAEALATCGVDPANVHLEKFGARAALTPGIAATEAKSPHPPEGPTGPGPAIQFARSAIAVQWSPSYGSLLEFAEACDVPTRWSCRTGVCHNCETALLSGQVHYNLEPLEPPAPGSILLCVSTPSPASETLVLDL